LAVEKAESKDGSLNKTRKISQAGTKKKREYLTGEEKNSGVRGGVLRRGGDL